MKAFIERWTSWAGFPQNVVTDRGAHRKGGATWWHPERDRKTVPETLPSNTEEIETVLSECVTAKNELARHQGFSPAQHVRGKQPRMPGSITDVSESFGTFHARYDETSPFYLRHRARAVSAESIRPP